jgi:hypothetical protein
VIRPLFLRPRWGLVARAEETGEAARDRRDNEDRPDIQADVTDRRIRVGGEARMSG